MIKKLILALPVIFLSLLYYQEVRENRSLRSELIALEVKVSEKSALDGVCAIKSPDNSALNIAPGTSMAMQQFPSNPDMNIKSAPRSNRRAIKDASMLRSEFFADRELEGIDEALSINDGEKSQLKDRLSALFQSVEDQSLSDEERDAQFKAALSAELGEERANLYIGIQRDREIKAQNDRIELASSMFTKHLGLTVEQEDQVSTILRQVDAELGNPSKMITRKISDLHSPGGNESQDPSQAMKQFGSVLKEIRDKRRSALNDRLQSVLTKDQYNALISEQAASQSALWGLRGY